MTKKTKAIKVDWNNMTPDMIEPGTVLMGKGSVTAQLRIHILLNAIAADWIATTDQKAAVKRVNFILSEMAEGMRRTAVTAWVCSPKLFGMIEAEVTVEGSKPGTTKTVKVIVAGKMKAKKLDEKLIRNTRWWEFTKEPEFKAHDLCAKITALVVEADKVNKRQDKRDKVPAEILTALRAVEAMTPVS